MPRSPSYSYYNGGGGGGGGAGRRPWKFLEYYDLPHRRKGALKPAPDDDDNGDEESGMYVVAWRLWLMVD